MLDLFLMASPALLIALVCLSVLLTHRNGLPVGTAQRKTLQWCSVLPGPGFLLLFYSLVLHMHSSLGGWPASIGNEGFPPALNLHASLTFNAFYWFLLFTVFVWPILMLGGLLLRRRLRLAQIVAFGLSFWACWPLILLAPSGFLYWWWD